MYRSQLYLTVLRWRIQKNTHILELIEREEYFEVVFEGTLLRRVFSESEDLVGLEYLLDDDFKSCYLHFICSKFISGDIQGDW